MNQDVPLNASIGHAENHSDFKFESAHFRKQMHQSMTHFHRNLKMTESQYLMEQLLNKFISLQETVFWSLCEHIYGFKSYCNNESQPLGRIRGVLA